MNVVRRHLNPLTWIALLAILALCVLPTLSHARAHAAAQGAGGWAEVCTQQGPQRVALDADGRLMDTVVDLDGKVAGAGVGHLQHCPFCALSLDGTVLPARCHAAVPLPLPGEFLPAAFLHAPRTLHAWRSAQPRGPPQAV